MSNTEFRDDYSWSTYDDAFLRLVEIIQPERVLDIGAGSGKYGKLVRKMKKDAHITGIEIDQDVIKNEKLDTIYDDIAGKLALEFLLTNPLKNYDLVVIGDCIEHMKKSEGIDLLNLLNYRSSFVFVVTPDGMVMNKDPYYFGHISNWTERDFMWHDNFAYERASVLQMFLMRGLLKPEYPTMQAIVNDFNQRKYPLYTQNNFMEKYLELTYVDQMKTWPLENGMKGGYRAF